MEVKKMTFAKSLTSMQSIRVTEVKEKCTIIQVSIYRSIGKFSRRQINDIFPENRL